MIQGSIESVDPGFAREVSRLLESGDHDRALNLAQAGVDRYPWYPTGLLLLCRCFEASGKPLDALLAARKAEAVLPDAPVVKETLARLQLSQAQSYEQSMTQEEAPPAAPPPSTPPDPPPAVPTVNEAAPPPTDASVETIAERLQTAGPIRPEPAEVKEQPSPEAAEATPPSIVSPTVAEIFMQQGEYGEALRTYRKLVSQHPEDAQKYAARMEEIEELIRKQFFE